MEYCGPDDDCTQNAGYRVTTFSDGSSVLASDFDLPDMFILDKQLADVNGLELCKRLKAHELTKNIPVIMISASSGIEMLAKGVMADDSLEKPFTMKELRGKVAKNLKI
ncbi:MAG: response regulator [Agriterribacter sp.]